jgi:hypothetical protein
MKNCETDPHKGKKYSMIFGVFDVSPNHPLLSVAAAAKAPPGTEGSSHKA